MNENEARRTLIVRAFETAAPSPQWDDEDRDWATRSAAQIEGEKASPDRFIARRAGLATERLASRVPSVARALAASQWRPWLVGAVATIAFITGLALDSVAAGNRINVLAPPILAVLAWNLLVYLTMALNGLRRLFARRAQHPTDAAQSAGQPPAGWFMRWFLPRLSGLPGHASHRSSADRSPVAVFSRHWAVASSALYGARGLGMLHLGSALLAAGLITSLYLRGLAFEFQAGWESTFLSAPTVASLLSVLLGPASALTGIGLPDAAHLASIRFPGNAGENAGPWIHLHAVTALLIVLLPRLLMAGYAGLRARRLASDFPIPLSEPYFHDLLRQYRGEAAVIQVLPYSYQVPVDTTRVLNRVMQLLYGPATTVTVSAPILLGGEDRLRDLLRPQIHATLTIALFTLTATPEEENHAAFVRALQHALPDGAPLLVLIDEQAFQTRFGADSQRLVSRRSAWRRILATGPDIEPVFLALGSDDPLAMKARLTEVLQLNATRMVQNHGLAADARAPA